MIPERKHADELQAEGYTIDRHTYPWWAYKEDDRRNGVQCYTAVESELVRTLKQYESVDRPDVMLAQSPFFVFDTINQGSTETLGQSQICRIVRHVGVVLAKVLPQDTAASVIDMLLSCEADPNLTDYEALLGEVLFDSLTHQRPECVPIAQRRAGDQVFEINK